MRAFESLLGDGHSGMSIGFTKNILNRLIDGKPLTPIEDTEEVWGEPRIDSRDKSKQYQCKRMSSLFKRVAQNGSVTYSDINRYYCTNEENPNCSESLANYAALSIGHPELIEILAEDHPEVVKALRQCVEEMTKEVAEL